jgi:hypothetical protein
MRNEQLVAEFAEAAHLNRFALTANRQGDMLRGGSMRPSINEKTRSKQAASSSSRGGCLRSDSKRTDVASIESW